MPDNEELRPAVRLRESVKGQEPLYVPDLPPEMGGKLPFSAAALHRATRRKRKGAPPQGNCGGARRKEARIGAFSPWNSTNHRQGRWFARLSKNDKMQLRNRAAGIE